MSVRPTLGSVDCVVRSERMESLLPDDAAFAAEYVRLPAWRRGRCGALRLTKGTSRDRAFCAMWVRKESCVKALGSGHLTDLKSFSVLSGEEPSDAVFRDFDFGYGHLGSVCRLRGD